MLIQRYYLDCLSHASYLIADEQSGLAAVIDPQRDVDLYVQDAQQRGLKIKYVILTHFHADFVSGHIELRDRVGAKIVLGAAADAEFEHLKMRDGDSLSLGSVRLEALETPGHTPEGLTVLAFDQTESDTQPHAAFTGDTLFIGDVGRPDLLASIGVTEDELAEMLYGSIHDKISRLPDHTLVYPAHGAGSMCGKSLSSEPFSTVGEQKKYNYALQPMSKQEFMKLVKVDQPEAPDYFVHDAVMNRQERESLDSSMAEAVKPLSVEDVLRMQSGGAQIVDTRDPADFAGAHLRGSINIGISGKYATWAGTVLDRERPIVVIAEDDRVEESIMRLGRIGFDHVAGYLDGAMDSLRDRSDLIAHMNRISAAAVPEFQPKPTILDVRAEKEWDSGHIADSKNIPLNQLQRRIAEVPAGTIVVHCQGGYRSSIAASILLGAGRSDVYDLVGGYKAWQQSKLPTIESATASTCGGGTCSA